MIGEEDVKTTKFLYGNKGGLKWPKIMLITEKPTKIKFVNLVSLLKLPSLYVQIKVSPSHSLILMIEVF